MNARRLRKRLNQILPCITSKSFLSSEGIGNEIACYIFDYPPEGELSGSRAHQDDAWIAWLEPSWSSSACCTWTFWMLAWRT